jgi:hypothetical protein
MDGHPMPADKQTMNGQQLILKAMSGQLQRGAGCRASRHLLSLEAPLETTLSTTR